MEAYERLETEWAAFNGLDPAGMVACASGTAALHLALEALQLPPGSEVVTCDFNMIAVPRAVAMTGLTPVFVDCRADDLLMDPRHLEELGSTTADRALIAVHVYGRQCPMEAVGWWCKHHGPITKNEWLIEDLAEAHGVAPNRYTDAACWSFYQNKIVAGCEGGAVWFRDPARAALARQLRSLGFTAAHDFNHVPRGHNYRMSNAHAELILASLERYPANLARRRMLEEACDEACPPEWRMPRRDAPWVYDLRIPGMTVLQQDAVVNALKMAGIAARHAFKPMSWQDEFNRCRLVFDAEPCRDFRGPGIGKSVPNSLVASREVIYLPLTPDGTVTEASCRRAFEVIRATLGK